MPYISDLDDTDPDGDVDTVSTFDTQLQDLKTNIQDSFSQIAGAVEASQAELNFADGLGAVVQTQLGTLSSDLSAAAARPYMLSLSVDSAAGTILSSGVTVSHIGTGLWQATHNIGSTNYATVATLAIITQGAVGAYSLGVTQTSNNVTIAITTKQGIGVDRDFTLHIART